MSSYPKTPEGEGEQPTDGKERDDELDLTLDTDLTLEDDENEPDQGSGGEHAELSVEDEARVLRELLEGGEGTGQGPLELTPDDDFKLTPMDDGDEYEDEDFGIEESNDDLVLGGGEAEAPVDPYPRSGLRAKLSYADSPAKVSEILDKYNNGLLDADLVARLRAANGSIEVSIILNDPSVYDSFCDDVITIVDKENIELAAPDSGEVDLSSPLTGTTGGAVPPPVPAPQVEQPPEAAPVSPAPIVTDPNALPTDPDGQPAADQDSADDADAAARLANAPAWEVVEKAPPANPAVKSIAARTRDKIFGAFGLLGNIGDQITRGGAAMVGKAYKAAKRKGGEAAVGGAKKASSAYKTAKKKVRDSSAYKTAKKKGGAAAVGSAAMARSAVSGTVAKAKQVDRRTLLKGAAAAGIAGIGGGIWKLLKSDGSKEKTEAEIEEEILQIARDNPVALMPNDGSYTEEQWKKLRPQQMIADHKLRASMIEEGIMDAETGELTGEMEMDPDSEYFSKNWLTHAARHALAMPSLSAITYGLEQSALGISNWAYEKGAKVDTYSIDQVDEVPDKATSKRLKSSVKQAIKWLKRTDSMIRNLGEPGALSLAFIYQGFHDMNEIVYDCQNLFGKTSHSSRLAGNITSFMLLYPILVKIRGGVVLKRNEETTEIIERMEAALTQIDAKLKGFVDEEEAQKKHDQAKELQGVKNEGVVAKAQVESDGKARAEEAKATAEEHKTERVRQETELARFRVEEAEQKMVEAEAALARDRQETADAKLITQEIEGELAKEKAKTVQNQELIDEMKAKLAAAEANEQRETREDAAAREQVAKASDELDDAQREAEKEEDDDDPDTDGVAVAK